MQCKRLETTSSLSSGNTRWHSLQAAQFNLKINYSTSRNCFRFFGFRASNDSLLTPTLCVIEGRKKLDNDEINLSQQYFLFDGNRFLQSIHTNLQLIFMFFLKRDARNFHCRWCVDANIYGVIQGTCFFYEFSLWRSRTSIFAFFARVMDCN